MNHALASKIQAANSVLITEGNLDAVGEFFTADYVAHVTGEDMALGHDGIRKALGLYQRAFSQLEVEVEVLVEENDRIAWQRTFRGSQTGAFKGFPASGRAVAWRDMVVSRFRDGLISEEWIVSDLAERLLLARKR